MTASACSPFPSWNSSSCSRTTVDSASPGRKLVDSFCWASSNLLPGFAATTRMITHAARTIHLPTRPAGRAPSLLRRSSTPGSLSRPRSPPEGDRRNAPVTSAPPRSRPFLSYDRRGLRNSSRGGRRRRGPLADAEAPGAGDGDEPLAVPRRGEDPALAPARGAGRPRRRLGGGGRGRRGGAAAVSRGHGARWRGTLTGASRRAHGRVRADLAVRACARAGAAVG